MHTLYSHRRFGKTAAIAAEVARAQTDALDRFLLSVAGIDAPNSGALPSDKLSELAAKYQIVHEGDVAWCCTQDPEPIVLAGLRRTVKNDDGALTFTATPLVPTAEDRKRIAKALANPQPPRD